MRLFVQIRKDMLASKKIDKDKYKVLQELYMNHLYPQGYMQDMDVIDFLQNYITDKTDYDVSVIRKYLPFSESELRHIIDRLFLMYDKRDASCIGRVMIDLKTKYPGRFDGKLASNIIKNSILP